MSATQKQPYRKRHMFARSLDEVVKIATKPLMDKQGKVYGALLANWPAIVGEERARLTRPGRLQFPAKEATGAVLHLNVHPAHAPELHYAQEQIIEQCARYFGYRAITRLVLHADHGLVKPLAQTTPPAADFPCSMHPESPPNSMQELLQRVKSRIMSNAESP